MEANATTVILIPHDPLERTKLSDFLHTHGVSVVLYRPHMINDRPVTVMEAVVPPEVLEVAVAAFPWMNK